MFRLRRPDMVTKIIEHVRKGCLDLDIEHGAIGVGVIPLKRSRAVLDWMQAPDGVVLETSVVPITPNDDTFCYNVFYDSIDGEGAGDVEMMITGLRRLLLCYKQKQATVVEREGYTSGALPDSAVIRGTSNMGGAVAIEVLGHVGAPHACYHEHVVTFCIAVSGGTEKQNEAAAWRALDCIKSEIEHDQVLFLPSAYHD